MELYMLTLSALPSEQQAVDGFLGDIKLLAARYPTLNIASGGIDEVRDEFKRADGSVDCMQVIKSISK